jgi:hypothetical protein
MSDADKPDDPLTIVTVKGVEVEAWKRAKECAKARDEMMGPWLSRALTLLADQQERDKLFPPDKLDGKSGKPGDPLPPLPVFSMAELEATLLAARAAVDRRVPAELMAEVLLLLENTMRAANGRPLRKRPLPLHRLALGFVPSGPKVNPVPSPDKPD